MRSRRHLVAIAMMVEVVRRARYDEPRDIGASGGRCRGSTDSRRRHPNRKTDRQEQSPNQERAPGHTRLSREIPDPGEAGSRNDRRHDEK